MFDHLWGDAGKIYKPPIMFDHLWGDAEKIYKPPIMFDHLWGDAEKIDEPPIMFDHLWGDAEKIYKPPIMFDHLWGDAEKIDEPPIMFDHLWEQLSRPPDKCDCYQTGNDLECNYCTRMSKLWEQLSRPPDKCVGHQTGNDLGCNHYTRLSKLWEQLSRPPDRCDCYLVSNNLSKLPCGGCNYCIRMNKQWEQLTRPSDECNCHQAGNDLSKLPCGVCKYCTRMSKQWEQFPLDVDDVLPSTVIDPLKIINADIRTVNVEDAKESTLHTPAPNWCSTLLVSDIRDKQREDPDLILAVNWVFNETVPTQAELAMSSTIARFYWSNRNLLSEKNGIIYYRWIQDTSSRDLIIVPRALKEVVLSGCHDEITAGHFSSRKTLNCSTQKKANLLAWTSSIGDSRNIAPPWIGPSLVVQIFSGATYKVKGEQCFCVLHYNILLPSGERPYDPIMFDHLGEDVKKVSDPSPHYTETILGVPMNGIHTPGEPNSNFKGSPKSSEGSNSAIEVVANEKIKEAADLMANKQVSEAINLVPLQDPITSHSSRPRKLPRYLNDYNW